MALLNFLLVFFHITSILSTVIPDEAQSVPCNSCCQGPAGIPGVPGSNGLHGRDGLRGESGMKGDVGEPGGIGERGPPGPQGPACDKGDRGLQGFPGKVGPKGPHGHAGVGGQPGADGRPGPPGPKGNQGGMLEVQKSAFSVFKTSHQLGNVNDVLTFDDEDINIGSDFNLATDKFTCEIPGTYCFMFKIFAHLESDDPVIALVKDDETIAVVNSYIGGESATSHHRSSTGMAIVQLSAGNQAWLKFSQRNREQVYGSNVRLTSFSGFLLYPE